MVIFLYYLDIFVWIQHGCSDDMVFTFVPIHLVMKRLWRNSCLKKKKKQKKKKKKKKHKKTPNQELCTYVYIIFGTRFYLHVLTMLLHIKKTLFIIILIIYLFASAIFLKALQNCFDLSGRTINSVRKWHYSACSLAK